MLKNLALTYGNILGQIVWVSDLHLITSFPTCMPRRIILKPMTQLQMLLWFVHSHLVCMTSPAFLNDSLLILLFWGFIYRREGYVFNKYQILTAVLSTLRRRLVPLNSVGKTFIFNTRMLWIFTFKVLYVDCIWANITIKSLRCFDQINLWNKRVKCCLCVCVCMWKMGSPILSRAGAAGPLSPCCIQC